MCRSTRSTSSSARTTTSSTPASPATGARICTGRRRSTSRVFEYWTHALVLCADARHPLLPRRRCGGYRRSASAGSATVDDKPTFEKCSRACARTGAFTIRDIDDDVLVEKEHPWASRKPSKRALQLAFYRGEVTISERAGMLKTYELMDRHFGWEKRPRPATEREVSDYMLDRALRAQGVVSLDSVCYLDAPRKPAMRKLIERRVRRGELVPVAIEGAGKQEHWAPPERSTRQPAAAADGARPHPLAVRSADHPAQAAEALLRLRAPLRGLCAEGEARVRLFRASGAGRRRDRRSDRPEDRPERAEASDAEMELGRTRRGARRTSGAIEEELHRFEAFQLQS